MLSHPVCVCFIDLIYKVCEKTLLYIHISPQLIFKYTSFLSQEIVIQQAILHHSTIAIY